LMSGWIRKGTSSCRLRFQRSRPGAQGAVCPVGPLAWLETCRATLRAGAAAAMQRDTRGTTPLTGKLDGRVGERALLVIDAVVDHACGSPRVCGGAPGARVRGRARSRGFWGGGGGAGPPAPPHGRPSPPPPPPPRPPRRPPPPRAHQQHHTCSTAHLSRSTADQSLLSAAASAPARRQAPRVPAAKAAAQRPGTAAPCVRGERGHARRSGRHCAHPFAGGGRCGVCEWRCATLTRRPAPAATLS
jgi:hypothetical protein